MDSDLFDLVGVHEKLGAVSSYNMELLENWKEEMERNEVIDKKLKSLTEGQVSSTTEIKEMMKLRKELDEQEKETDRLKNRVRVNRTNEEKTTRTVEYLTSRVEDLEHRLEAERNRGRLPSAEAERMVRTHNTELNSVRNMFKAIILKKDEEIKELDQITIK